MNKYAILIVTAMLSLTPLPGKSQPAGTIAAHAYYGEGYIAASFPGEVVALAQFLAKQGRYPEAAREANVEGRVIVRIFIDKDGRIANPEIIRKIGAGCDEEAMRLAMKMPQWLPATYGGKPVPSVHELCVTFKLE